MQRHIGALVFKTLSTCVCVGGRGGGGEGRRTDREFRNYVRTRLRRGRRLRAQNFFRGYPKLGGMTGTAATESAEFASTYNLQVTVVPTNRVRPPRHAMGAVLFSGNGDSRENARHLR